ncbi:MAG: hypothetical protein H0W25_09870, partial [Acidimicrobiia bacterium]|nr:hypothetical protein [Acidimicrobiia bacterium]
MGSALALTATLGTGSSAAQPGRAAAAAQEAAFNNGTGQAIAESIRVDPVSGGLSFGVGIGQALAGHQNTVGAADSRALNFGVIGVSLAGEGCDGGDPTLPADEQPQPVIARTGDEGAEEGYSAGESFAGGQIEKFARATADPFAEAITTGTPFEIPGVLTVAGSRSVAHSGVVNGDTREAIAATEISGISFAGGQIRLGGFRSEAIHRSGAVDEVSGTFSIGSASIAGVPLPVENPLATLAQLNGALLPLGFEIQAPTFSEATTSTGTIAVVSPLSIAIVPSALRDGLIGPIVGGLQPAREALFDALLEADCGNSTYITILDIALNAISAGGRLGLEFGGVQATTGSITRFDFGTRPPGAQGPSTGVTPASGARTPTGTGSSS